jgi:DNA-directed RNA polymerase specialized sigma24 family protein
MPCPEQFDRDAAAAEWLPWVEAYARLLTGGRRDLEDDVRDAAIDALIRSLDSYSPAVGPFKNFVRHNVTRDARRAFAKAYRRAEGRPEVGPIAPGAEPADRPRPDSELSPDTLRALPPELRRAVELYCVEGHTMREAATLCGVTPSELRRRLIAAAERLGMADAPAPYTPRAKRLRRA